MLARSENGEGARGYRDAPLPRGRLRRTHRHHAGLEVDVVPVERDRLADPHARPCDELDKVDEVNALRGGVCARLREQSREFVDRGLGYAPT